jgi:hypothetical protein
MSPPFLAISTRSLETDPRSSLFYRTDSQPYCPSGFTIGNVFLYSFPPHPFAEILLCPGFDPDVVTASPGLSRQTSSQFFTKSVAPDPEASRRGCPSRDQAEFRGGAESERDEAKPSGRSDDSAPPLLSGLRRGQHGRIRASESGAKEHSAEILNSRQKVANGWTDMARQCQPPPMWN